MKMAAPKNLKNTVKKVKRNEEFVNGVTLRNNENIERALKRFKKVVENAGVIYDVKNYRHFEKPSVKKREAIKNAKRNLKKEAREQKRF